jgi:PIN domain nuclease of toxin-antitoxin system
MGRPMNLLLDTHTVLWWLAGSDRLSSKARKALESPSHSIWISAATIWEMATKFRLGKLPLPDGLLGRFEETMRIQRWLGLPITIEHARRAGTLEWIPF